jgi:hypothetical protein
MTEPMKRRLCDLGCGQPDHQLQDFARYLDDMIYLRELETHDLSRYAAVVVPDGTDTVALNAVRPSSMPSACRRLSRHLRLRQGE